MDVSQMVVNLTDSNRSSRADTSAPRMSGICVGPFWYDQFRPGVGNSPKRAEMGHSCRNIR